MTFQKIKAALLSYHPYKGLKNAVKINTERKQPWPFYKREPITDKTHPYNEFERSTVYILILILILVP